MVCGIVGGDHMGVLRASMRTVARHELVEATTTTCRVAGTSRHGLSCAAVAADMQKRA
jgi:hypothetical protein